MSAFLRAHWARHADSAPYQQTICEQIIGKTNRKYVTATYARKLVLVVALLLLSLRLNTGIRAAFKGGATRIQQLLRQVGQLFEGCLVSAKSKNSPCCPMEAALLAAACN
jgi:hypothetical protein